MRFWLGFIAWQILGGLWFWPAPEPLATIGAVGFVGPLAVGLAGGVVELIVFCRRKLREMKAARIRARELAAWNEAQRLP
jgi:hypothetical protein